MNYVFQPNNRYRMPPHFGPSLGPMQGLNGRRYSGIDVPALKVALATFKADPAQLKPLLPPKFVLREPCYINFNFEYFSHVEWLAGRGYNAFCVSIPVTFMGEEETAHGDLLLINWENRADCITAGREDLGVAKMYCEIPEPQKMGDNITCRASWDGFEFAALTLSGVKEIALEEMPATAPTDGVFHYKYIPKTGVPGEADAEYAVIDPVSPSTIKVDQIKMAEQGNVQFHKTTWEQLPTLVSTVNALSELTLGECTQAVWVSAHGGKDLSDMRIIR